MRRFTSALAIACALVAFGCGPKRDDRPTSHRPSKPAEAPMEKGLANTDTWKPVSGFGVKVRIPNGWRWAHQGAIIFAVEPSGNSAASFVVVGATDKDDAIAKLKESRDALKLETGKSSAQAPTMLGGISFLRQDYENSIADGKACHAMALVGDAPNGHGFVLVLGYVHEGQDPLSEDLRDAINSISPG